MVQKTVRCRVVKINLGGRSREVIYQCFGKTDLIQVARDISSSDANDRWGLKTRKIAVAKAYSQFAVRGGPAARHGIIGREGKSATPRELVLSMEKLHHPQTLLPFCHDR